MDASKTCGNCGRSKPASEFYAHRRRKDGLRWSCKTCEAEYQRSYHRKYPEVRRAQAKRRRALRKGAKGKHTLDQWQQLCEAHGHKCLRCGLTGVPLTEDHLIPLSLGGCDSIDNIQLLCVTCNSMKGSAIADYRGGFVMVDKSELDRLTVAEAAERLGVKEQAIRKRIQRGTLQHDKDETGRVYVYLDAEAEEEVQGKSTRDDTHLEALVESLQDQVTYLRAELARRGETHLEESRRKDSIIAALTQRIPELEAPRETRESPLGQPPIRPERAEPAEPADPERVEPEKVGPERVEPERTEPERVKLRPDREGAQEPRESPTETAGGADR